MGGNTTGGGRILGSPGSVEGEGIVRMEDRFESGIDDVWSALTGPSRLARDFSSTYSLPWKSRAAAVSALAGRPLNSCGAVPDLVDEGSRGSATASRS